SYITSCMALYQSENASLAISAINYLVEKNIIKVSKEAIFKGIKNTFWLGRFERMLDNPKVYIDGAHNIHGISALVTTIQQFIDKGYNPKIVFSALKDKETSKMLEKLLSLKREIYVTEFDFYRSKKAIEIAGNYDVFVQEDWKVLIKDLISQSQEHDIIIITGSLYFISQVRPFLLEMRSDMNE
ncbi:MAG: cyanophycin synthetase, partial [Bacilli bacterium]